MPLHPLQLKLRRLLQQQLRASAGHFLVVVFPVTAT